jgi:5-hydroxyisourate hydrolase
MGGFTFPTNEIQAYPTVELKWSLVALAQTTKTGQLTTHVLDVALGKPAASMRIDLYAVSGDSVSFILTVSTNSDGRCDAPLLAGDAMKSGEYELRFHAGDYLKQSKAVTSRTAFLNLIPIRFGISDPGAHYHVPLLLAPYGYSTYRGS